MALGMHMWMVWRVVRKGEIMQEWTSSRHLASHGTSTLLSALFIPHLTRFHSLAAPLHLLHPLHASLCCTLATASNIPRCLLPDSAAAAIHACSHPLILLISIVSTT